MTKIVNDKLFFYLSIFSVSISANFLLKVISKAFVLNLIFIVLEFTNFKDRFRIEIRLFLFAKGDEEKVRYSH